MNFRTIGLSGAQAAPLFWLSDVPPARSEHQAAPARYRMRFASFIRNGKTTCDRFDEVPEQLRICVLAVHAFDAQGLMLESEPVNGWQLTEAVSRLLSSPKAQYLNIHHAGAGRYAARVERE